MEDVNHANCGDRSGLQRKGKRGRLRSHGGSVADVDADDESVCF